MDRLQASRVGKARALDDAVQGQRDGDLGLGLGALVLLLLAVLAVWHHGGGEVVEGAEGAGLGLALVVGRLEMELDCVWLPAEREPAVFGSVTDELMGAGFRVPVIFDVDDVVWERFLADPGDRPNALDGLEELLCVIAVLVLQLGL